MQRVEVAIVGGGPAGISTALFLAHARPELTDRIVVLEKERYPREKFCAGGVGARADKLLGSIGVHVDVPSVWLNGVALRTLGETSVVRDGDIGRVVRRIEFDHELARIALQRGISVLDGARVSKLQFSAQGVHVESSRGTFLCRALVGADGVQSVVRRALGLDAVRYRAQALEIDTEPVDSDLDRDLMLFDASRHELPGYYWDFPTLVGGREMVCRGVYLLRTGDEPVRVEIQELLAAELAARGLALSRYKKKRYAERGFSPHAPVSRSRVLLVGEAAGIDPVTGEGIGQAIQYGATAGRYLGRKLEARDLGFGDWAREIRHTSIGRDLHVREAFTPLFYGPRREHIERFLLATPEFIRVGLRHFAGKPWGAGTVLRAGWGASRYTAGWLARGAAAQ